MTDNRSKLIQAVRGGSPEGPFIYDLRPFGGRNLVISGSPLSEEYLRQYAREEVEKWRDHLVDMLNRGPIYYDLLENERLCSRSDWESIRGRVSEEVRERYDHRFRTEGA